MASLLQEFKLRNSLIKNVYGLFRKPEHHSHVLIMEIIDVFSLGRLLSSPPQTTSSGSHICKYITQMPAGRRHLKRR